MNTVRPSSAVRERRVPIRRVLLAVASSLGVTLLAVTLLLIFVPAPSPQPRVVRLDLATAEELFLSRIAAERADPTVFPECVSQDVPARGNQVGVVVLFYGYTSCPRQMHWLAQQLAVHGYRVLVPLFPQHGVRDTFSEPRPIDVQSFTDFGDSIADIASGLDRNVVLGGLSGGGALAMWIGSHRPDIDRVVAIAPLINPAVVPTGLQQPAGNLIRWLPNQRRWWDEGLANQPSVPRYSYGQYETHSIAALMALGRDLQRRHVTASERFIFIVNDADGSVDNQAILDRAVEQRRAGDQVMIYRIPATRGFPHEFIDLTNPENVTRARFAYPILVDVLTDGVTSDLPGS